METQAENSDGRAEIAEEEAENLNGSYKWHALSSCVVCCTVRVFVGVGVRTRTSLGEFCSANALKCCIALSSSPEYDLFIRKTSASHQAT